MSYEVLARKWRPGRFEQLVGQSHVVRPLVNALDSDRVHHAFLFTGTRGVGKTTIARILAKSLNCEQGVSSTPCGECSACKEVDEGRFVDLIEVDAASRTKVDDTRELLDNVQYAPTRGRYKVYLIDEVHMLSGHSFNALLKTLEEPPPHVKFLLATTDPQKLPVTILSRCLQFSLKRLSAEQILGQLKHILEQEHISFDEASLVLLANAADGSMRDGLSLLDQAIAFGGGAVNETDVREMLGTIDQGLIDKLLSALAAGETKALLAVVDEVAEHGGDYGAVLDSLLLSLYHISLAQIDSQLAESRTSGIDNILHVAGSMNATDTQLYYQIGMHGKRDMSLAPDPKTGLEMTLLRMVAFRPVDPVTTTGAVPAIKDSAAKAVVAEVTVSPPVLAAPVPAASIPATDANNSDWSDIVGQLKVSGILAQLAQHTSLQSRSEGKLVVVLDEAHAQLHNKAREAEFCSALEAFYGYPIKLTIKIEKPTSETPAAEQRRQQDEKQLAAENSIAGDPNVQALQESFNARVNPGSIRSKV